VWTWLALGRAPAKPRYDCLASLCSLWARQSSCHSSVTSLRPRTIDLPKPRLYGLLTQTITTVVTAFLQTPGHLLHESATTGAGDLCNLRFGLCISSAPLPKENMVCEKTQGLRETEHSLLRVEAFDVRARRTDLGRAGRGRPPRPFSPLSVLLPPGRQC
jgi:hypothetical protein